jgi:hypothetical protein
LNSKRSAPLEGIMATEIAGGSVIADVKCYFCGHISGQIIGTRHQPLRVSNFVPRPGYSGPEVRPGTRLRCERCRGPVFLEDASNVTQLPKVQVKTTTRRKTADKRSGQAA